MFMMILKETKWIEEKDARSSRIVLTAIKKGEIGDRTCVDCNEFSTHIELSTDPCIGEKPQFILGHYYTSLEMALMDFDKRSKNI